MSKDTYADITSSSVVDPYTDNQEIINGSTSPNCHLEKHTSYNQLVHQSQNHTIDCVVKTETLSLDQPLHLSLRNQRQCEIQETPQDITFEQFKMSPLLLEESKDTSSCVNDHVSHLALTSHHEHDFNFKLIQSIENKCNDHLNKDTMHHDTFICKEKNMKTPLQLRSTINSNESISNKSFTTPYMSCLPITDIEHIIYKIIKDIIHSIQNFFNQSNLTHVITFLNSQETRPEIGKKPDSFQKSDSNLSVSSPLFNHSTMDTTIEMCLRAITMLFSHIQLSEKTIFLQTISPPIPIVYPSFPMNELCDSKQLTNLPILSLSISKKFVDELVTLLSSLCTNHCVESTDVQDRLADKDKEILMLKEIIARQTQQLTQLTIQVSHISVEHNEMGHMDDSFEQIKTLQEHISLLKEEVHLLEAQLEEQNNIVKQTFELRCTLQQMHLQIQAKDAEIMKLQEHRIMQPITPVGNEAELLDLKQSQPLVTECLLHITDSDDLYICKKDDIDHTISVDKESDTIHDEEEEEDTELTINQQLLEDFSLRTLQASFKMEIEQLETELFNRQEKIALLTERLDTALTLNHRLEKKLDRDVFDLKGILRKERSDKERVEAECQRLLSQQLECHHALPKDYVCHENHLKKQKQQSTISPNWERIRSGAAIFPPHVRLTSKHFTLTQSNTEISEAIDIEHELTEMRDMVTFLKDQLLDKTNLVTYLLKKYGLNEDQFRGPIRPTQSSGFFSGLWQNPTSNSMVSLTVQQMQKIMEETLLENIRLRTDLQTLAEEKFNKHIQEHPEL